jgi:succinate-semialdehyde dehydrogenase/glutarate-semialdehyde dehydrogenase
MSITSINPTTGETMAEYTPLTEAELEAKLALASAAFREYRRTTVESRAAMMLRAGAWLDAEKASIARTMTLEVGKTLKASLQEVEKCAECCRFGAEHAAEFLADEPLEIDGARAFIRTRPLGPVLAVMPWNFPLWQVIRFAVPALLAGNVGLLKHAENVPQCALILEEAFRQGGFPEGIFQNLRIETAQVASVLEDERVVAATLTGSERAGSAVGALAGKHLKKTVLELGGSDPFVVMPSADLDRAVETAVRAPRTMGSPVLPRNALLYTKASPPSLQRSSSLEWRR